MYGISNEEFNTMVNELSKGEYSFGSNDTLYHIIEKTIRPRVREWCKTKLPPSGRGMEEDLMQEIRSKVYVKCVTRFLRRNGDDAPINEDPVGFEKWLVTVAVNVTKDFAKEMFNYSIKERFFEEGEEELIVDDSGDEDEKSQKQREVLRQSFAIVIESDAQVYKVLTWLAQFLIMLDKNITKIKSNEEIIAQYESKTLFEMRDMLFDASKVIDWLQITDEQRAKIECALQEKWDEERVVGQIEYSDFYMKKGAKATISDWVNRMNNMIIRVVGYEALND